MVALDKNSDVSETNETNNVSARAVTMSLRPRPQALSAPASAATGQPIAVSWTVRNAGAGTANGRWYTSGSDSYRWYDKIYLSTNAVFDGADLYVGEVGRASAPLVAGASYTSSATLTLPATAASNYYLLVNADANADVNEASETNNVFVSPTAIAISAPDLRPVALNAPTTALTQVPISISWTVSNAGTGPAVPDWYDDIYLSTDDTCCGDSNDVKAASFSHTPDLAAGASYTASASVRLPKVGAGTYRLFAERARARRCTTRTRPTTRCRAPSSCGRPSTARSFR